MKTHAISFPLLIVCTLTAPWLAAEEELPVGYRMQEGVRFYLRFDEGNVIACRSTGENTPDVTPKGVSFESGIKGKGLAAGEKSVRLRFARKDILSFETPGSVSLWIKPVQWRYPRDMPEERNGHQKRVAFAFFLTEFQRNGGYLGFQRFTSHRVGGKDGLVVWFSRFEGINGGCGKKIVWPDGEWHNVVLTWDPLHFKLYADGELAGQCTIQRKIRDEELPRFFVVSCPEHTVIDEFIIYNRILSPEDIRECYASMKTKKE